MTVGGGTWIASDDAKVSASPDISAVDLETKKDVQLLFADVEKVDSLLEYLYSSSGDTATSRPRTRRWNRIYLPLATLCLARLGSHYKAGRHRLQMRAR